MTSGQKTALSLLLSVILFCAFSLAAFAGLFSAIDARFYEPAKIYGIRERLKNVALACDEYLSALGDRFATGESSFLKNPSVASFVEAKAGQEDVFARSELLGDLRSSTQGFLGLRVLDKNQNSIHYSTFASDILRRDEKNNLTAYKNYLDCLSPSGKQEIPAQIISCEDTAGDLAAGKKVYFDADKRVVFSYPLYDRYSVFRGTALFYVNALDFSNALLTKASRFWQTDRQDRILFAAMFLESLRLDFPLRKKLKMAFWTLGKMTARASSGFFRLTRKIKIFWSR